MASLVTSHGITPVILLFGILYQTFTEQTVGLHRYESLYSRLSLDYRGAKLRRLYGLLGAISLLSPE